MVPANSEELGVRPADVIVYLPKGGQLVGSAGREVEDVKQQHDLPTAQVGQPDLAVGMRGEREIGCSGANFGLVVHQNPPLYGLVRLCSIPSMGATPARRRGDRQTPW